MSTVDIAIVGMACRFPGANSVNEFWQNLCQSKECLTQFSHEELLKAGVPLTDIQNPNYVPVKGILKDIDLFDAGFFHINPADASIMDPQQRIFLECAWEALEHSANIPSKKPDAAISVFAGITESCYLQQNLLKNREFQQRYSWLQSRVAAGVGTLSTQLSYRLNLHGSSINLNTACSTGLVAVIYACQELLLGRSHLALAGSVAIELPQTKGYLYKTSGIDSRDGHCRPFAHNANGTVFSNGVGIVVLKRLADAIADRDTVYAVIKGYGMNNDGSDKLNYYAPSVNGQAACIQAALNQAKISAADISFIEAHGTATELGDFIEITALNKVFRQFTQKKQYCILGSVKSNIGHSDISAGMASLIKAALCTYHQKIPATLHFEKPNSKIRYQESPFYVNSELISWPSDNPYAGVSAFGIGGTNSHIILSTYSSPDSTHLKSNAYSDQLIILSAKSKTALQQSIICLQDDLQQKTATSSSSDLADIAYTLQTGRDEFNWRSFIVGKDINEITNRLVTVKSLPIPTEKYAIVFMFPGQGSEYAGMAYSLYQQMPLFKRTIDQCSKIAQTHLSMDIEKLLFSDLSESLLNRTTYVQTALFVVEYALAQLLMHYGIQPSALIGHSVGEYAAACLAEVFSLEDALFLISERGRLMEQTPAGSMLAIFCNTDEFKHYQKLFPIELAAHNADHQCIATGSIETISELMTYLKQQKKSCRYLNTNHAFHSRWMESIFDPFYAALSKVQLHPPKLPVISNLTGHVLTPNEAADPSYWSQHLRRTVQFKKGLDTLTAERKPLFIEVGPGHVLSHLLPHTLSKIHTLSNVQQKCSDSHQFLTALGFAWQHGIKVNWQAFYTNNALPKHVALPAYPFERQRYWIEANQNDDFLATLPKPTMEPKFFRPTWIRGLSYVNETVHIADHQHTWVIFKDQNGLCDAIISVLQVNQIDPIIVEAAENYQEIDEKRYCINPAEKSHYLSLLTTLKDKITHAPMIVHAFSCNQEGLGFLTDEQINQQLQLGFYSVMYLTQAYLDIIGKTTSLRCAVITQTSQQILEDDIVVPVNATLSGICGGISQEHPLLRFQLIDVNLSKPAVNYLKLSNSILEYCIQNKWDNNDAIIAFRQGFQWKLDYTSIELNPKKNRLKDRGVYLITGGLGGIALTLCEKIAETISQPVFVLLSRSKTPPISEWEDILYDETHQQYDQIKRLQRLKTLGATLVIYSVDVALLQPLKSVIHETLQSYGEINGVIHAAGLPGGGLMQLKTYEAAQAIFSPKVHGAYHLAEALKGRALDFIVLCSSISALIGLPGHIDYCGANACLDAFSASHLFSSSFVISINWNTWKEIGMVGKTAALKDLSFLNVGNDISPEQGQQLFMQIMKGDCSQVAISNYEISEFAKIISQKNKINRHYDLMPHESSFYSSSSETVTSQLLLLWQDILGIQQINIEDDFFDLGGHSLNMLELLSAIYQKFYCSLTLSDIYAARTVAQLAALIEIRQSNSKDITAIQLHTGKTDIPCVFLFPPVSGTVFCYNEMVSLWDTKFSIYGLQDQSVVTGQLLFNDLITMAKAYCARLQKIQPHGPYYLIGYSFGGMLAYEIAHLLAKQGEKIQLLALIDSWAVFPSEARHESRFKKLLEQRHPDLFPFLIEMAWKRMQLLSTHQPSETHLDLVLFKADKLNSEFQPIDDPYNGWHRLTTGCIIRHLLPANHETIMHKEHSLSIVKHLQGVTFEHEFI